MNKLKVLLLAFILLQSSTILCQIKLPKLLSNGVVFQRNTEIPIWGWAAANEEIEITFLNKVYKTTANANGKWELKLPELPAGGPFKMVLKASNKIEVDNILIGDVWVCSGQSNMELPMERVKEKYIDVIKNSENKFIRQFLVPDKYDFKTEHQDFDDGNWVEANPENVLNFSAVAYFFAKEIYEKNQIPIGLINASLGGSPVEAWLSEDALKTFPDSYQELQKFKNDDLIKQIQESDKTRQDNWYAELNKKDEGILNNKLIWNQLDFNDSDWNEMKIPGYWVNESLGNINGVVWFRKTINIPKEMANKPAKLWLGRIVDQDFAYINGEFVGTTGYQYPPRRYNVAPNILKEGKNTITVRVINNIGNGGFLLDKPYYLAVGNDTINLKGNWKYKLGAEMKPLESQAFIRWKPTGLYNKMISPLLNFPITGVIWYQGESNTWNPEKYAKTFPALIKNWRQKWSQGDFPFLFVQLANFMEETTEPTESNWAALRQAQFETLSLPNTGMAVTIDLGEWNDIHPLNKEDVGKRLALNARKIAYGENITAASPSPKKARFKKNKAIIEFNNVGSDLVSKNSEELNYFSISNDGENFEWAKAKIKGNKVIVWNNSIKNPKVVRYAWSDNPATANLFSKEGLPATPFEIRK